MQYKTKYVCDFKKIHQFNTKCSIINVECINFRLQPEVYHKLVKMLALEEDAVRFERVIGDKFCRVVQQLQTGERQIVCSD